MVVAVMSKTERDESFPLSFFVAAILAISVFSNLFMCPMMSFAATILFNGGFNSEIVATWAGLTIKKFPMAFFWQLFVAGPLVRFVFGKMFKNKKEKE